MESPSYPCKSKGEDFIYSIFPFLEVPGFSFLVCYSIKKRKGRTPHALILTDSCYHQCLDSFLL